MYSCVVLLLFILSGSSVFCNLEFYDLSDDGFSSPLLSINLITDETKNITLLIRNSTKNMAVNLMVEHSGILEITPPDISFDETEQVQFHTVTLRAIKAGETTLFTNATTSTDWAVLNVQVYKNQVIEILSLVMGWAYFLAWSISFYPQIWENYKRKSVVGLNFDFMAINMTGYICYAAFNLGLYYIPLIREQYAERYPFSIVSVLPNDIFFSVHALVLTFYTGLQCFWYDRGGQKISWFGQAFHYVSGAIILVSVILCFTHYLTWLDFLYINSYIKLSVTICKYAPQVVMNHQRKSTDGWSIGMVLLDVAGGVFCILQMFLNAYNYEKWEWILENPTKFWLGILSLLFDFVFMAQHYCLYNASKGASKRRQHTIDLRQDAPHEKEALSV